MGDDEQDVLAPRLQLERHFRFRACGPEGVAEEARRLHAGDRAGPIALLALVLVGRLLRRNVRVIEMQVRPAAHAQVEDATREPRGALVGFREVGPDAFDRPGEQALETHGALLGGSADVVHFLLLLDGLVDLSFDFSFAAATASSARSVASRASSRSVQKMRWRSIHSAALSIGPGLKVRKCSRPDTRRRTRSARSRMRMCLETELSEMSNGAASSVTRASPLERRCRSARRVGSARAIRVWSRSMTHFI